MGDCALYSIVIIVIIVIDRYCVICVFVYLYSRFMYKIIDEYEFALDCTCLIHARYTRTWEKYSNKVYACQQMDDGRILLLRID